MYDKRMFLSQRIADKNSELMNLYFKLNKRLDNFVNYIGVSLNMNKMSDALHHKYAHLAPINADDFSDYNALYSYRSHYDTILGETIEYDDIMSGIEDVLKLISDIDISLSDAKVMGQDEQNDDYVKFITDQIKVLRIYKKQFILLNDKVNMALSLGNTLMDIDFAYEDYLIEPEI
jgi:hypothetical protein